MSTYVVGLDPSLTASGVAAIAHPSIAATPNIPTVRVVGERGSDTATPAETTQRIRRVREAVLRAMPPSVCLVAIEALPFKPHPKNPGLYRERAVLLGGIEEFLTSRGIPFVEVAPKVLKLWATGNGDAEKIEVHAAMVAMWPRANLYTPQGNPNDNASDALAVASIGAQHLGWHEPELPHQYAPKVRWPEGIAHR